MKELVHSIKISRKLVYFCLSIISILACVIMSASYYKGVSGGNSFIWITYLTSMVLLIFTFFPEANDLSNYNLKNLIAYINGKKFVMLFYLVITAMFFAVFFQNFKVAPWSYDGVYDDAAWGLYFIKTYIFAGKPFQAVVDVPYSGTQETLFGYVAAFVLRIFGANLFVFNIFLVFLAYITFIFTVLLIQRIFKKYFITALSALAVCFSPILHGNSFCGHRYAIVLPLMMASLYFWYIGFTKGSKLHVTLGAILAGLCVSTAPLGRQYIGGIVIALVLFIIFSFKNSKVINQKNIRLVELSAVAFLVAAAPFIIYVAFNPAFLSGVEREYFNVLLREVKTNGTGILVEYYHRMLNCLFQKDNMARRFSQGFIPIPIPFYLLIVPGIVISLFRKRFYLIMLTIIPFAAAYVSAGNWDVYDYRILMAIPFIMIMMAQTMDFLWVKLRPRNADEIALSDIFKSDTVKQLPRYAALAVSMAVVSLIVLSGVIPAAKYIHDISMNSFSIYTLNQMDVAEARFLRGVIHGDPSPSPELTWNELELKKNPVLPDYDTLISQRLAYAVGHLFWHDYDTKDIFSVCATPFKDVKTEDVLQCNKDGIKSYPAGSKNLKVIWEVDRVTQPIINEFSKLNRLGSEQTLSFTHKGITVSFYVLNIKRENIDEFKTVADTITLGAQ